MITRTLIDGYNLLHVSGIMRRGIGPGGLERARLSLLNQIAAALDEKTRRATTIVFDAKSAPPDRPSEVTHRDLNVLFARDFEEADDLLEYLIRTHSAPKSLTVVSSDRRVQRCAKRRKARPCESESWFKSLQQVAHNEPAKDEKKAPIEPVDDDVKLRETTSSETDRWIEAFGLDNIDLEGEFRLDDSSTRKPTFSDAGASKASTKNKGLPVPPKASAHREQKGSATPGDNLSSSQPPQEDTRRDSVQAAREAGFDAEANDNDLKDVDKELADDHPFPDSYFDDMPELDEWD